MALIDSYRTPSKLPLARKAVTAPGIIVKMITGQITPGGHGGLLGLHAPLSYPMAILGLIIVVVAVKLFIFHA